MVYPQNEYDRPDTFLGLLGDFWSTMYDDRHVLQRLLQAELYVEQDCLQLLAEVGQTAGWHTVPVWSRRRWLPVVIRESDVHRPDPRFDQGWAFDGSVNFAAIPGGIPLPLPTVACPMITDSIDAAVNSLHAGIDFRVENHRLYLATDPFETGFPVSTVYQDGAPVDREVTLWLYDTKTDADYIYQHFGYVLGLRQTSSEHYKRFIAAALDAIAQGTSVASYETAVAAVYGIELAETTETVEAIIDQGELCIVTDHKVYTFPVGTTPAVEVGDTVVAGQSMIAEFQIWSSPRQPLPSVQGIAVPAALLSFDAVGDLVFPNTLVPVVKELDNRAVSFELQGDNSDIDQFWDAAGVAVADFFWQTYSKIPAQVNPAEFLLRHVWRQRCIIVTTGSLEPVVGSSAAVLRKIQPPHVLVLFTED